MGAILLANAAIGTVQERKAENVIESLNQFQAPHCKVIRDGEQVEVSGAELVPGDLVCLEAGERVPADLRLLQAWNLEVNEATLTGESLGKILEGKAEIDESRVTGSPDPVFKQAGAAVLAETLVHSMNCGLTIVVYNYNNITANC